MNHFVYYDVESLPNVFTTAVWEPSRKRLLFFYLVDDPQLINENRYPEILEEVRAKNRNLPADTAFQFHDLSSQEGAEAMARYFGVSDSSLVNNPKAKSSFPAGYRMVCDTIQILIRNDILTWLAITPLTTIPSCSPGFFTACFPSRREKQNFSLSQPMKCGLLMMSCFPGSTVMP